MELNHHLWVFSPAHRPLCYTRLFSCYKPKKSNKFLSLNQLVWLEGFEPPPRGSKPRMLPLNNTARKKSAVLRGRARTPNLSLIRRPLYPVELPEKIRSILQGISLQFQTSLGKKKARYQNDSGLFINLKNQ